MDLIHAIILGTVQGLTEFLPVSSSAHLNIFPWIFGWEEISESFDVALHIGTLFAVLIFFYKDWINLISKGFKKVFKKEDTFEGKMFWYIFFSTIIAGVLSIVLDKVVDHFIGENIKIEMGLIAIALIVMGIILYIVDKKAKQDTSFEQMNFKQSFIIGLSQALAAAFPGVSRSGITMTVARGMGIDRESSARYSFLLAAPIVAAAALVDITKFTFSIPLIAGILASFVVGLIVIKFLMNYLKKGSYKVFAIYRVIIGIIIIALLVIR